MENNGTKTNGVLAALILYIMVFGIKVDTGQGDLNGAIKCEPMSAPVFEAPPPIPTIDREHMSDKTYVVRVLVNHINLLNKHVAASNKQTSDIYNTYTKCVIP